MVILHLQVKRVETTWHASGSIAMIKEAETGEVTLNLDWKIGIAAKDWDSIAKKEKIEGVELELNKLEGVVDAIHEDLINLKDREAEMRSVSEKQIQE